MLERNQRIMEKQFVVFQVDREHYGVDIGGVREILRLPEITRVPQALEYVEGIINPRGTVIPVIDLHKRFALPKRENTNETRVMVLSVEDSLVGAIVDSVSEVLSFTDDQIDPAAGLSMAMSIEYVTGVAKLEDRLVIMLDYVKVFTATERQEFADMAGAAAT